DGALALRRPRGDSRAQHLRRGARPARFGCAAVSAAETFRGRRVLIVGTGREGQAVAELAAPVATSVIAYTDDAASAPAWTEVWGERVPVHVGAVEGAIDLVVAS